MNDTASDSDERTGDSAADDISISIESSPSETEKTSLSTEDDEIGESVESDEEVNIVDVSDEEKLAGGEESTEVDMNLISHSDQEAPLTEMEVEEQNDVSMKESTQSEFSGAAEVEDQEESSESDEDDEKTESRIFQNLPPNFPSRFAKLHPESIRPRILIEKTLHKADVDESRDRLSISGKKMKEAFLLAEEDEKMKSGEAMDVQVIEPDGKSVCLMTLRRRRIGNSRLPSYVLTGGWHCVVARNSDALARGGFVRVWYFRVNGELEFAIQVVDKEKKDCDTVNQMSEKWWHQNIFGP